MGVSNIYLPKNWKRVSKKKLSIFAKEDMGEPNYFVVFDHPCDLVNEVMEGMESMEHAGPCEEEVSWDSTTRSFIPVIGNNGDDGEWITAWVVTYALDGRILCVALESVV